MGRCWEELRDVSQQKELGTNMKRTIINTHGDASNNHSHDVGFSNLLGFLKNHDAWLKEHCCLLRFFFKVFGDDSTCEAVPSAGVVSYHTLMRTWQLPQDMEPGVGEMFAQCPTVWVSSQSQLCSTRKSRKNQETVKNPHQFQPLSTTGEWYVCVQPVYWHDQAHGSYMVPITVDPIPEKTRPRDGWGECSPSCGGQENIDEAQAVQPWW